jgi:hypothetical protein
MLKTRAFARLIAVRAWFFVVMFSLFSNLPVSAQFGGDAFSCGTGTQTDFPNRNAPEYIIVYHGATFRRMDLFSNINIAGNNDPFDAGVDNYVPKMRNSIEAMVPVHFDLDMDDFEVVFFVEPTPQAVLRVLRRAGKANDVIRVKSTRHPFYEKSWNLDRVETEIKKHQFGGGKEDRFLVLRKNKKSVNIYFESKSQNYLAALEERAAQLAPQLVERLIHQGVAACYRKNWNLAWSTFQKILLVSDDDAQVFERVANVYRRFDRDMEACFWYAESLRVTDSWSDFECIWKQRDQIEAKCANNDLDKETENLPWIGDGPRLKVCFEGANKAGYDSRLRTVARECLFDWCQAAEGRLDYEETDDPRQASIIYSWKEPDERYLTLSNRKLAPIGNPHPERIGETTFSKFKTPVGLWRLARMSVTVFARDAGRSRLMSDDVLRAVCLHETGHALGISRHLRKSPNVMFPYCNVESPELDLQADDKGIVKEMYANHVIMQAAVDKYVGMRAQQEKLVLPQIATNNLKQNQNRTNNSD